MYGQYVKITRQDIIKIDAEYNKKHAAKHEEIAKRFKELYLESLNSC